ncbi:MAG: hypothetical protein AB1649_29825, partial [Chloroflexota bacterium]
MATAPEVNPANLRKSRRESFDMLTIITALSSKKIPKKGVCVGRTPPRTPLFSVISGNECASAMQPCAVI